MPSELEKSIEGLIIVFHRYAKQDGEGNTLSKKEFRLLMEAEFQSFLQGQKDPDAVNKIMADLDTDKDGKLTFEEFVALIVGLSTACEKCYQLHVKETKKTKK